MAGTKKISALPEVSGGQFKIIRQIGEGGMAVVYEAIELATDRRVALKMLQEKYRGNLEIRKRFSLEAKTGARLDHINHVTVYSSYLGLDGEVDYYTMELLEGVGLDKEIARRRQVEWPFAVELARQVCEGVSELDRLDIVHRDIKPGNIFLTPRRGGGASAKQADFPYVVKLLDLGICKLNGVSDLSGTTNLRTKEGVIIGTLPYMAPEIFRGEKSTHAVDIYAVGVLLFRLLTGRHPIERGEEFEVRVCTEMPGAPSTFDLLAPVPGMLDELVLQALEKDPAARPENARILAKELSACLNLTGRDNGYLRALLFYASTLVLYACLFVSLILLSSLVLSKSEQEEGWDELVYSVSAGASGGSSDSGRMPMLEAASRITLGAGTPSRTGPESEPEPEPEPEPEAEPRREPAREAEAEAEAEPEPGPELEEADAEAEAEPESEHVSGVSTRTRATSGTIAASLPPSPPPPDCIAIRDAINDARQEGAWKLLLGVLDKGSTKKCVELREMRKLRTLAYKETLQFELCVSEGEKVLDDKEVEGWVRLCLRRSQLLPVTVD